MVQNKLPLINSSHGSETRNIINELIKLFNGMGYTYDEALSKAHSVLSEAKKTNDMNKDVQRQLNNIILENGNSEAEVVQARGDAPILKDRLDKSDGYLEKTSADSFYSSAVNHKEGKAIMSIVDDDLRPEVYTLLKPIVEQEKVPITCAVITSRVGDTNTSITLEQMKEMQELGFEFVSHTDTHPHLATLTEPEIERELKSSQDWLFNNGFDGRTAIVYPYGSHNEMVRKVARKYYSFGVDIDVNLRSINNTPPINTYNLDRIYYNLPDGTNRINEAKAKIDDAIANDEYLILGMHCFYNGFDTSGLIEVIQYAKQKGLDIVALEEGIRRYANILDIPSDSGILQIGADGSGNIKDYSYDRTLAQKVNVDTPITDFPIGLSITHYTASNPNGSGFPVRGGLLETFRSDNEAFNYQIFYGMRSNDSYERYWSDITSSWSDFKSNSPIVKLADVSYLSSTPYNSTDKTAITYSRIQTANASGFPENSGGILINTPFFGTGYASQMYYVVHTNRAYRRFFNGTSWSPFTSVYSENIYIPKTLTINTIPSKESRTFPVVSADFISGSNIIVNPKFDMPEGILFSCFINAEGSVKLTIFNTTSTAIDLGRNEWIFKVLKN